ncbi:MAG: preQ(1) synthase [Planctomycetota bacterium]
MPDPSLLECFDNPNPQRDYMIEHIAEEFTSVCPKTGHPDFGVVTVQYVPDKVCVELKSLKIYLQDFRNEGIFYEAVTNAIAADLEKAMAPRWMMVITDWRGRGGIRSTIRVEVGRLPSNAPLDDGYDDDDEAFDAPQAGRPPGF